jgi:sugar phosphate isomerase/epimerase
MKSITSRRNFLRGALGLGAAAAGGLFSRPAARAHEPFVRAGKSRFRTSLVAYSFRRYLLGLDAAHRISLFDLIDFCSDQGFEAIELTGYYFPWPCTDEYLAQLKRRAHLRGVAISGTAMGGVFAHPDPVEVEEQIAAVKAGVDRASFLGAPYLRTFAGGGKAMEAPGALETVIAAYQVCSEYAGRKGIFIGLENDGGILPDTVLAIAQGVKSPWFGLNLDLGNYHTADVYADVARCAPYAINVHFKLLVEELGKPAAPADFPRLLQILRNANYQGYLAFEYETEGDPFKEIPEWKRRYEAAVASG